MATTTRGGQAHYVEFDEYVDSKILRTRDVIRSTDIMVALVAAVAAVLGYLLVFVLADHWLGMDFVPPVIRLAIGFSILGGSLAWACWRIGLPHRRRINRLFVAREIETHESTLEGNLLNLVDLQQASREVDQPVMRSIEKRAAVGLSQTDLDGTVDRGPLMRSTYTLLGLVVVSCLYTLLTVSLGLKPIGPSLMRAFGAGGPSRPVVALLATSEPQDLLAVLRLGVVDAMVKPLRPDEVLSAVRQGLGQAFLPTAPPSMGGPDPESVDRESPGTPVASPGEEES